jgi:serpin B
LIINDWVSEQTHDRIKDLLPEGSITVDTRLVLTNAIYFLADWLIKFPDTLTDNQSFTRLDGSLVTVPMMNLRSNPVKLLYYDAGNCRIIELPYKGNRLVMNLILPDSGTYNNFEQNLSAEIISELINGLDSMGLVTVRIPRFEFTTASISLVDAFKNLGMTAPFSPSADFSGISHGSLAISDIIHKAFVKVDEKGTEAAAATAVIIGRVSDPAPPPEQFVANRPFIFFIRDTMTGAILFMGRILDPLVKE